MFTGYEHIHQPCYFFTFKPLFRNRLVLILHYHLACYTLLCCAVSRWCFSSLRTDARS